MELNKFPYPHNGTILLPIDAPTLQAENDNYNVLYKIKEDFDNLKNTSNVFGNGTIIDKSTTTTTLGELGYKCAYRNSATTDITFTDTTTTPNPTSFILGAGDLIYYIGMVESVRQYLQIKQPYQITYVPFIDKNGQISFTENRSSNIEPQILKGPMGNAIWNYNALIGTVRLTNEKYLEIPVSSIKWLKDSSVSMLPWDNYSIMFFDDSGESININYKDLTFVNNVYYNKITGTTKTYYIRILLDIPSAASADNFTIRIY